MIQNHLPSIVVRLLSGQYMAPAKTHNGRDCYKLYSGKMNPLCYCTATIVKRLKDDDVLIKKNGMLYISRKAILKLRKNNIIKRTYLLNLKSK